MKVGLNRKSGLILMIVLLILFCQVRYEVVKRSIVVGSSMAPTLYPGQNVIYERISLPVIGVRRGDIVIVNIPDLYSRDDIDDKDKALKLPIVKRVVGLPGEELAFKNRKLYVRRSDGSELVIDENYTLQSNKEKFRVRLGRDQIFIAGDNRYLSQDSMYFGPVSPKMIVGIVRIRLL